MNAQKKQYIVYPIEGHPEVKTVTETGIKRICTRDNSTAYTVTYELNHKYFSPMFDGDCYYKLLFECGNPARAYAESIRKGTLEEIGYKF